MENLPSNQVIGSFRAIVNGRNTALAGCTNRQCAQNCLRKDPSLHVRADHRCGPHLPFFIPAANI